ncbi:folylpolyglutamate synthase/dihydrofolate synthase family protein [soil metagenome]
MADALRYLDGRVDLERISRAGAAAKEAYRLDRMRALAQALGDPQADLKAVHIAGTKGKGSTCEMTAACLEGCGYTVGIYTSPHILDVRERIRINRVPVGERDFADLTRRVAQAARAIEPAHGPATFFEVTTAMAFLHFRVQAVDAAVIEVGLGGLLDCTNIISPLVTAITMIGLDHTEILGNTVELIAAQKAGIFKPGVPALTIPQEPKVLAVLEAAARDARCTLSVLGRDLDFTARAEHAPRGGVTLRATLVTERNEFDHVAVPLAGDHQAQNCGLALAIIDALTTRGFYCDPGAVSRGLETTSLPGRFELAVATPRVILDGAHNPDSIAALLRTLKGRLQYDSLVMVFGCAADKDAPGMLRAVAGAADKVIFTRATGNARAAEPRDLARKYHELSGGKMFQVARDLGDAMELALGAVGREDVLCVTGSFYIVGEVKRWLLGRGRKS